MLLGLCAALSGCRGTRTLSDPTLEIRTPAGAELGVATDYGILFLGRTSRSGEVQVVAWFGDTLLGAIIASAILINLVAAALAGATIPLILKRLGIDPALAGGVVLTTVTDVVGFLSFLGLATVVLL